MKHTSTETREVQVVTDVTCDCCGKSMRGFAGNINGVTIRGSGAYDSVEFPDMCEINADVCESCAMEWFKGFKINPINPYES